MQTKIQKIDSNGGTIDLGEYGSVIFEQGEFSSPTLVKIQVKQKTESTLLGCEPSGPWIEITILDQNNQKSTMTHKRMAKPGITNWITSKIKLAKDKFSTVLFMSAIVIKYSKKEFDNFIASSIENTSEPISDTVTAFYRLKNGIQESEKFWELTMVLPSPLITGTALAVTLVNTASSPEYLPPTLQKIAGNGSKPIILIHGLVGSEIREGGENAYKGWEEDGCWQSLVTEINKTNLLQDYTLYCYKYPTFKNVKVNGESLVDFISQDAELKNKGNDSFILIAHSMGGLVGRYAMNTNNFGDKVSALITLATPHHGSPAPSYLEAKPEVVNDGNISSLHYALLKFASCFRYPMTDGIKSLRWDNYDNKLTNIDRYGLGINDSSNVVDLATFNNIDAYKNKIISLMGNCPTIDGKFLFNIFISKDILRQAAEDINSDYSNFDLLVPKISGVFDKDPNNSINTIEDSITGSLEKGKCKLYNDPSGGLDHEEIFSDSNVISDIIAFLGSNPSNNAPTIAIVQPDGISDTADTTYTITWTAADSDNAATITLYYDSDTDDSSGQVQIVTGLTEGTDTSYIWNASSPAPITGVANGNYYIRAKIDDGVNSAVYAYSSGVITINHITNQPPVVTNVSPTGSTGDIAITYDLADADVDNCSIVIQYQGGSVSTTWTTATTTGTKTGIAPGAGKTITWNSATDESAQKASDYKIRITPNDGTTDGTYGESSTFSVDNNVDPTIIVNEPDGTSDTADTTYTITWTATDSDNAATITLYYDTDTTPGGEVQIVTGLIEGTDTSYPWNASSPTPITGVVNGNYYIKAKIDDGINSAVYDYSSGVITIGHPSGALWVQATASAAFSGRKWHTSVVFDIKMWVIGGFDGSTKNDVWYSSDGVTWTQATASAAFSARYDHTSVVFDNKMWVIGGYDGGNKNDVWYSSDGINWTQATASAAFSGRKWHTSVVFDNKMWVIGGNDGSFKDDVWFSSDGVNWTEAAPYPSFSARYRHTSIVFDNKMWVIGGFINYQRTNDVWYSSDGVSWWGQATASAAFSTRYDHTSVVFDNKMWVIGGVDGSIKSDVWYSSDGVNWTEVTASAFSARTDFTSVTFDSKMWVIGGGNYKNDVWYSE